MNSNSTGLIVPAATNSTNSVEATLRDIKGPVEIPDYWMWLWIGLGAIALVVIGYFIWKHWLRAKLQPAPVLAIPPHIRAKQSLKEALALLSQPKPFAIAVSDTLRHYLEERFNLRAPERTTEEFLNELQTSPALDQSQKQSLADFLEQCDLVKFAKYEPGPSQLQGLYESALELVEDTEPKPPALPGQPQTAT